MIPAGARDHKIEPEYLGPLADRPLAETAKSGSPSDLFPGASAFLSPRVQRGRLEQWKAALPLAGRLLRQDEHVLYVAHGMEVPPLLTCVALGYMAMTYHQVLIVLTETRLIEVLLSVRGKKAETRVRSYPWSSVRELKIRFGKLSLVPVDGRKQSWSVPVRCFRAYIRMCTRPAKAAGTIPSARAGISTGSASASAWVEWVSMAGGPMRARPSSAAIGVRCGM